jgi:hypothetical protein
MKKTVLYPAFILLFITVILIIRHWTKEGSGFQDIENVTQNQTLNFSTDSERVVTKIITVIGEVDGEFTLDGLDSLGPGKINQTFRSDWYDNQIEIKYEPEGVTEGYLKVKVELY